MRQWVKSSKSVTGNCIEVRAEGDVIVLRESDEPGMEVRTTRENFEAFRAGMMDGEFAEFGTQLPAEIGRQIDEFLADPSSGVVRTRN